MAYPHLQAFATELERRRLLVRISDPVDPRLEISALTDRVTKAGGPALLFERPKGSEIPLLINTFGTAERMALALGVDRLDDIAGRIRELIKPKVPQNLWEKLSMLPKLHEMSQFIPKVAGGKGACQEVVVRDGPFFDRLPLLTCWPKDGGRYVTFPLVFTKDPETGERNVGVYRIHVHDDRTAALHWQLHKHGRHHWEKYQRLGKRMEVAVVLGADPATMYTGTAPMPDGLDELLLAGFLRKEPVTLVKGVTVDVEVPAEAEIVLEGYVDPDDLRTEGPFGDHTGFYCPADLYPSFHVTALTMRAKPLYPTIIVGIPPQEDFFLGKATERIFLPLLQMVVPEIVDMNFPAEGIFHNAVLVSIKKRYPGQARKVMHALWGMGQMMFTRLIVVVDEDVDVQNVSEAAWIALNNIDARRDMELVDGPVDILTHATSREGLGSKVGLDATRKGKAEGMERPWPERLAMTPDVVEKMEQLARRIMGSGSFIPPQKP